MSALTLTKRVTPPSAPPTNKVAISVNDSGQPQITDENGVTTTFESVFGQNYQYVSRFDDDTHNNTNRESYLDFDTENLPLGTYELEVEYIWNYSSASNDFIGEIQINGSQLEDLHQQEPKDTGTNQRHVQFRKFTLVNISGVQTFDFLYGPSNNGNTARVYQAKFWFKRVA